MFRLEGVAKRQAALTAPSPLNRQPRGLGRSDALPKPSTSRSIDEVDRACAFAQLSGPVSRSRASRATIAIPESERLDGQRAGDAYGDIWIVRTWPARASWGSAVPVASTGFA
jgi:hypothetical protein